MGRDVDGSGSRKKGQCVSIVWKEATQPISVSVRSAAGSGLKSLGLTLTLKAGYAVFYYTARAVRKGVETDKLSIEYFLTHPALSKEGNRALQAGLFVGVGVFTVRSVLALLRRRLYCQFLDEIAANEPADSKDSEGREIPNEQKALARLMAKDGLVRSLVGGAAAGVSMLLIEDAEMRRTLALYTGVRAADSLRWRWGKSLRQSESGVLLPESRIMNGILFGLTNGPIMFAFLHDPSLMPRSYYRWICWMGNVSDENLDAMVRAGRRHIDAGLPGSPPHVPCAGRLYPNTAIDLAIDFFHGLARAARVYVPAYIVPALLLPHAPRRSNSSDKNSSSEKSGSSRSDRKGNYVLGLATSVVRSTAFLSSYQSIVKVTQTLMHESLRQDEPWQAVVSGFATGLACSFEAPYRVNELMLYCAPHSITIALTLGTRWLSSNGCVQTLQANEGSVAAFVFALSGAVILGTPPREMKGIMRRGLTWFLGPYA